MSDTAPTNIIPLHPKPEPYTPEEFGKIAGDAKNADPWRLIETVKVLGMQCHAAQQNQTRLGQIVAALAMRQGGTVVMTGRDQQRIPVKYQLQMVPDAGGNVTIQVVAEKKIVIAPAAALTN